VESHDRRQSILKGTPFEKVMVKDGIDTTNSRRRGPTRPTPLPNMQVSVHHPEVNVPVLWWRRSAIRTPLL